MGSRWRERERGCGGDARAAFEWLGKQPEIDARRVGLVGHRGGGLIAPTIAARTQKVAFVVALAEAAPAER